MTMELSSKLDRTNCRAMSSFSFIRLRYLILTLLLLLFQPIECFRWYCDLSSQPIVNLVWNPSSNTYDIIIDIDDLRFQGNGHSRRLTMEEFMQQQQQELQEPELPFFMGKNQKQQQQQHYLYSASSEEDVVEEADVYLRGGITKFDADDDEVSSRGHNNTSSPALVASSIILSSDLDQSQQQQQLDNLRLSSRRRDQSNAAVDISATFHQDAEKEAEPGLVVSIGPDNNHMVSNHQLTASEIFMIQARFCGCLETPPSNPYFCPLPKTHCGVPSSKDPNQTPGCVNIITKRRFALSIWPVVMVWYASMALCLCFTSPGRNAIGCCLSVLIPGFNSFLTNRILNRNPHRANRMILNYLIRTRHFMERRAQQQQLQQQASTNDSNNLNNNATNTNDENTANNANNNNENNAFTANNQTDQNSNDSDSNVNNNDGAAAAAQNANNTTNFFALTGLTPQSFGISAVDENNVRLPIELKLKTRIFRIEDKSETDHDDDNNYSSKDLPLHEDDDENDAGKQGNCSSSCRCDRKDTTQKKRQKTASSNSISSMFRSANKVCLREDIDNIDQREIDGSNARGGGEYDDEDLDSLFADSDDHVCIICHTGLEDGDRVGDLPCMHTFHVDCLKGWLVRRNVCPLCLAENVAIPRYGDEEYIDPPPTTAMTTTTTNTSIDAAETITGNNEAMQEEEGGNISIGTNGNDDNLQQQS